MVEKNLTIGTIIIAVALTAVITSGIFYFGAVLQDRKVEDMVGDLERFEIERRSQDISRSIAGEIPGKDCEIMDASISWAISNLGDLEDKIEDHEDAARLQGDGFQMLKREYTNLLLEYWLLTREAEEKCGLNTTRILYFYGDEELCPRCPDQGTILTHYRKEYKDELLVFPLDVTLDMDPINLLVSAYVLDEDGDAVYPTLKIEEEVHRGFIDKDQLGSVLEEHINNNTAQ